MQIKDLLYNKGFTIAGAKKQIKTGIINSDQTIIASQKTTMDETTNKKQELIEQCLNKHEARSSVSLEELLAADAWARKEVYEYLKEKVL